MQGQDRPATATEPSVCFCVVFRGFLVQSKQPYTAISAPSILNTRNKLIGEMVTLKAEEQWINIRELKKGLSASRLNFSSVKESCLLRECPVISQSQVSGHNTLHTLL